MQSASYSINYFTFEYPKSLVDRERHGTWVCRADRPRHLNHSHPQLCNLQRRPNPRNRIAQITKPGLNYFSRGFWPPSQNVAKKTMLRNTINHCQLASIKEAVCVSYTDGPSDHTKLPATVFLWTLRRARLYATASARHRAMRTCIICLRLDRGSILLS